MKRVMGIMVRLLLVSVIILGAAAIWKRNDIRRLLAVNSLFAESKIVANFGAMGTLFFSADMTRGPGPVSELPLGETYALPPEVEAWIDTRSVTSLVVLKDGALVHESYYQGTAPGDLRISWSVAKSFLSALTGILIENGTIEGLDIPVTQHAPQLIGSAYDGATLGNVMHMASGVAFNEDYIDFSSDINRMGRVLALGGALDDFAAGLTEQVAPPGTQWHYVSIDTHVIGMVLRGATGRSIPDLLQEYLLWPLGLEADPYYVADGKGVAFVLGGLNLTTRDYARFGQMIAQGGMWQGAQIVPNDWIAISTIPTAPTAADESGYGLQWWIPQGWPAGEFIARGVYGQYIYINQNLGVVIATNATDRGFTEDGVAAQNEAVFRLIADAL
ncbi:MAG: serine hydrolase [Rhodobacteraceae bacterium]|nr:serine hydrolase [Paracoccaceae bacterium]